MKPIAIIGDSWAVGPAPGQPSLAASLADLGLQSYVFAEATSGDVLALITNYISTGGMGAEFSMVLLSTGGHDMMSGIPAETTTANLVAIGAACATIGLKCEVIGFPQIVMNGSYATFPNLNTDAAFYDAAAASSSNLQILHGAVGSILSNFPAYENTEYSEYIPHYNQDGSDAFAADLVGIYAQLNS